MSELEKKLEDVLRKNLAELKKTRLKLESLERMHNEPIAIIGLSCRLPGGANDPENYWKLLVTGKDGISEVPKDRWNIDEYYDPDSDAPGKIITRNGGFIDNVDLFDPEFFRISHREAGAMDPQQRVLLEVVWEAIERAAIAPSSLENSLTGVFIGASYDDHAALIQMSSVDMLGPYSALSISLSALNGRISYTLGLLGPSMTVDTACSSSLVSLHLACNSLQRGECNLAIAGGIYLILSPTLFIILSRAKMLAPDGHCKTFDISADGYARGEGAGILILKRLSDAERDHDNILAIIRSSSVNQDGPSSGLTVPNRVAQAKLIEKALADAKLNPTDISYVEAHGTGTELGDPIEVGAIKDVYGKGRSLENPLFLGSVKSNIGHLEGAAGVAGIIKVILSLNNEIIPPNLHFHQINPKIDLDAIPAKIITTPTPWKYDVARVRRAGISSFGFTGTNAHVIIEEPPKFKPEKSNVDERPLHILTLSAKSDIALSSKVENIQRILNSTDYSLADICYTLNTGRNHEKYRIAIIAKDINELKLKLKSDEYYKGEAKEKNALEINFKDNVGKLLNELAKGYVKGAVVDWKKFDASYTRQKLQLPTYPFQRKKFDIIGIQQSHRDKRPEENREFMFVDSWEQYNVEKSSLPDKLGHWLILGDGEVSSKIIDIVNHHGGSCRIISLVDHPKTKDEFLALLKAEHFNGILHISSAGDHDELSLDNLRNAQVISTEALLNLTQALLTIEESLRIPLFVMSSTNVLYSAMQGLFKTIATEHPDLDIKLSYLDSHCDEKLILKALFNNDNETLFKIEGLKCYVPRLSKLKIAENGKLNIHADSTYLITGGLGGLGLTLAKWLTENAAGRLVLTGRKEPDRNLYKNLEQSGTEIIYEKIDISDETSVKELLERLSVSDKPLKGIFHLAGVLDDATFLEQDWKRFENVFAAKVYGSYYLHHYAKELDYFVLFSSLASTLGSPGQANYASACAFIDGLCEYRKLKGLPAHSLSWGPWSEVGMAKNLVSRHARVGMFGIKPEDGIRALEQALLLNQAHITIANMDWKKYINHLIKPLPWLKYFGGHITSTQKYSTPQEIKDYVVKAVRDVFATPDSQEIDDHLGFFDMGMDSLMAVELRNRLQIILGKEAFLDSVTLFSYPTIDAICKHLVQLMHLDNAEASLKSVNDISKDMMNDVGEMSMDEVIRKLRGTDNG